MIIAELLKRDPGLEQRPQAGSLWESVRLQSESHTQRDPEREPIDIARPNEPDDIKLYRKAVKRQISKDGYSKFLTKTSRIFAEAEVDITEMSKALSDWLDSKPFKYQAKKMEVWPWVYRVLMPYCLEDPNAWLIPFPYAIDSDEPPIVAAKANERVPIKAKIVPCSDIWGLDHDHLVFEHGTEDVDKVEYPTAIGIDKFGYWLLRPRKAKVEKKEFIEYYQEPWYIIPNNDTERIMGTPLVGVVSRHRNIWYHESYIHAYYENGDEHAVAFSDSQAVRVRHSYPKMIMKEIPCVAEGCAAGKVKIQDRDGKPIGVTNCTSCKGTGIVQDIGPYGVLFQKSLDGGVAQYLVPPAEALKFTTEVAEMFLSKAHKAIGLDVLGNEVESGKAKEYRLEDVKDLLAMIATGIKETLSSFLMDCETLLQYTPGERKEPIVYLPTDFKLKDERILLENYNNSPEAERYPAFLEYINAKYDSEDMVRAYKAAINLSWLTLKTTQEKAILVASGVVSLEELTLCELYTREAVNIGMAGNLPKGEKELEAMIKKAVDAIFVPPPPPPLP
jgi:hypothetical protein